MDETPTLTAAEREEFARRCAAVLDEATRPGTPSTMAEAKAFQAALKAAGLAGLAYPAELGGAGLTSEHERIYREVAERYPPMAGKFIIGHGMCLPVLHEFGTPEQKARWMPDLIAGRTVWCQMFSEPGAGSDVASLQSRARRDGDEWVIDGQKVWTTLAHEADYGIVIVRTDTDVPKHAGISMFVVDMHADGVEVRPIIQIDGGRSFNEVFFTGVRVPADHLLGTLHDGWRQARAMLMYERVAIGSIGAGTITQPHFDSLVEVARSRGVLDRPVVRDALARLYALETTKALVAMRARAETEAGRSPGPGGSLGKLAGSVIAGAVRALALELAGPAGQAWDAADPTGGEVATRVVSSFSAGIAGGTDEIQRNIIGERVLGLPRDAAVDRDVPFRELLVGTQR